MKALAGGTQRLYWKGSNAPWMQPTISKDGIYGVDDFSTYATNYNAWGPAWRAFSTSTSPNGIGGYWEYTKHWVQIYVYTKVPLAINGVSFRLYRPGDQYKGGGYWKLFGSDDNANWRIVQPETAALKGDGEKSFSFNFENFMRYNYHKFEFAAEGHSYSDGIRLGLLEFKGDTSNIVPATIDDYDFYTDVPAYRLKKLYNKYYGFGE